MRPPPRREGGPLLPDALRPGSRARPLRRLLCRPAGRGGARHHAGVADPERRPILTRLSTYPRVRGLVIGAFAETSADVRLLLRETAEAAAARFWRDAGATSATAAQSVYMSVYRRRWGAEFALQGARMRIARAYLVTGQAEPAPRDPRGGGFDPGDAAAFAAASAPSLPGVPQGQSGFASRGG